MPETVVDLRSDTVTRPTRAMREAMMTAEVGDDVLGDDPTVQILEARIAELTGKAGALFVPSGTMGNQIAIMCHAAPGDEVVLERDAHIFLHEQGGIAANAGCLARVIASETGAIPIDEVLASIRSENIHHARVRLVCVENTHNGHGGTILPLDYLRDLSKSVHDRGVAMHLDGARLWHAWIATGTSIAEWAAHVDSVQMCFSKGLGAPIGSILAGEADLIAAARRHRKRLGGGMRQVGILAAACLHALDHHVDRLADDHRRARELAAGLEGLPGVSVNEPQTNIVMLDVGEGLTAESLLAALAERGVRMFQFGPTRIRATTHLDVDDSGIARAVEVFRDVAGRMAGAGAP